MIDFIRKLQQRQLASAEVAALRRLALGRRSASMTMLRRPPKPSPKPPGEMTSAQIRKTST